MPPAPYAVHPAASRGRLHPEPESPTRSPFQRDRDRVIHSTAFRRLQYKTQVFVNHEGDFFRTRLTHTIEVAQIARSIARALGLDEDLTEALALAHDLGHPPFGHAGEEALNLAMKPFGGFDHNAQSLRVATLLEARYAAFDGLNLTWETLEGLVKHNGPLPRPPAYIAEYDARHKLDLATQPSAEAQVAALADDIAYHSHDLDDGLRAHLFGIEDIAHLPVVGTALAAARQSSLDVPPARLRFETIRRVIDAMVTDLIAETGGKESPMDLRHADFHGKADILEGMKPCGSRSTIVATDSDDIGSRLCNSDPDRSDSGNDRNLHDDPGLRIRAFQLRDQLGEVLDGIKIVVV